MTLSFDVLRDLISELKSYKEDCSPEVLKDPILRFWKDDRHKTPREELEGKTIIEALKYNAELTAGFFHPSINIGFDSDNFKSFVEYSKREPIYFEELKKLVLKWLRHRDTPMEIKDIVIDILNGGFKPSVRNRPKAMPDKLAIKYQLAAIVWALNKYAGCSLSTNSVSPRNAFELVSFTLLDFEFDYVRDSYRQFKHRFVSLNQ